MCVHRCYQDFVVISSWFIFQSFLSFPKLSVCIFIPYFYLKELPTNRKNLERKRCLFRHRADWKVYLVFNSNRKCIWILNRCCAHHGRLFESDTGPCIYVTELDDYGIFPRIDVPIMKLIMNRHMDMYVSCSFYVLDRVIQLGDDMKWNLCRLF